MRDFQLPQRDQNPANGRLKKALDFEMKMRKTAKTSSNPISEADSKDDSIVLEPLKEFSEEIPFAESAENLKASGHPEETHPSEAFLDPTSTPSSSSETATPEVNSLNMEEQLVINYLSILKSNDLGPSKELVETLIDIVIKEFRGGVYDEEDDWLDKLLLKERNMIGLVCFMLVCSLLMVWFLKWSSTGFDTLPTPT